MQIGYARVSTEAQDTAMQRAAFKRCGISHIVEEKRSGGGSTARPLLEALLDRLKRGDVLVVYRIDRLARSLSDLLAILRRVSDAGATFRSLNEPIDTRTAVGEFVLHLLGAVAQLERSMIRERCISGMVAARARGVVWGARRKVTPEEVAALKREGLTLRQVAGRLGVHKTTCQRAWLEARGLPRSR